MGKQRFVTICTPGALKKLRETRDERLCPCGYMFPGFVNAGVGLVFPENAHTAILLVCPHCDAQTVVIESTPF